jgi:CDP-diacylglycerol--glycerol-3-phosphate 3-phosphatidyltransferase
MWNLPNKITISRVILIPIFMIFLFVPMNMGNLAFGGVSIPVPHFIAAVIFIVASCTDWLDGYYARKLNLVTNFGKFVDPLADKLLVTAAFVGLVEMGFASAWMVIIILAREFAVSGLRQIAAADGEVIAASRIAKWKTTSQIVAIAALLLHNAFFTLIDFPFATLCLWLAVILTIISGWDYFVKNKHVVLK